MFLMRNCIVKKNFILSSRKYLSFKHSFNKSSTLLNYTTRAFSTTQPGAIKVIETIENHKVLIFN